VRTKATLKSFLNEQIKSLTLTQRSSYLFFFPFLIFNCDDHFKYNLSPKMPPKQLAYPRPPHIPSEFSIAPLRLSTYLMSFGDGTTPHPFWFLLLLGQQLVSTSRKVWPTPTSVRFWFKNHLVPEPTFSRPCRRSPTSPAVFSFYLRNHTPLGLLPACPIVLKNQRFERDR